MEKLGQVASPTSRTRRRSSYVHIHEGLAKDGKHPVEDIPKREEEAKAKQIADEKAREGEDEGTRKRRASIERSEALSPGLRQRRKSQEIQPDLEVQRPPAMA